MPPAPLQAPLWPHRPCKHKPSVRRFLFSQSSPRLTFFFKPYRVRSPPPQGPQFPHLHSQGLDRRSGHGAPSTHRASAPSNTCVPRAAPRSQPGSPAVRPMALVSMPSWVGILHTLGAPAPSLRLTRQRLVSPPPPAPPGLCAEGPEQKPRGRRRGARATSPFLQERVPTASGTQAGPACHSRHPARPPGGWRACARVSPCRQPARRHIPLLLPALTGGHVVWQERPRDILAKKAALFPSRPTPGRRLVPGWCPAGARWPSGPGDVWAGGGGPVGGEGARGLEGLTR